MEFRPIDSSQCVGPTSRAVDGAKSGEIPAKTADVAQMMIDEGAPIRRSELVRFLLEFCFTVGVSFLPLLLSSAVCLGIRLWTGQAG